MSLNHFSKAVLTIIVAILVSCGTITTPKSFRTAKSAATSTWQTQPPAHLRTNTATVGEPPPTPGQPAASTGNMKLFLPTIASTPTANGPGTKEYFVAPNGSPNGNGSIMNPWDFQTALEEPDELNPGDIIWLRGGKYGNGGATLFNSKLVGTEGHPYTVRAYPGEHVVIDGALMVYREWTIFWGLEVMNSDPKRKTDISGSVPGDITRTDGFNIFATHTKFINNVVHDAGEGFGLSTAAIDAELYGNIAYNNGWSGPDRGHGYGVYAQNEEGTKFFRENIIFNNFGEYGIHVYGEQVQLKGFLFEGNINFNGQYLVGGLQPAGRVSLIDNHFFRNNALFGYRNQNNEDLTLKGNIFGTASTPSLDVRWWQNIDISGNRIWSESRTAAAIEYPSGQRNYQWDRNTYYVPGQNAFMVNASERSWEQWKQESGFDQNSSLTVGLPSGVEVFIRPNIYEAKRANIVIYNWDLIDTIAVDLSGAGLEIGDRYFLHNVQNYFEETIQGVYDGSPINIPMTGWTIATPIGWESPLQPSTFPLFGVFVLTIKE